MRRLIITTLLTFFSIAYSAPGEAAASGETQKKTVYRKGTVKKKKRVYIGVASYYSARFRGRKTAGGTAYRHGSMTAACNILPLGTWVRITNLKNKKRIIVRINDRMSSRNRRLVDLSRACAVKLDFVKEGVARVKVESLGMKRPR